MSAPPLLQIAAGRRARPRQASQVRPKELSLHLSIADTLRRFVKPDWRWCHVASGEHRDIRTAAKLKAMGVAPGWPDLVMICPRGRFHGLELKRLGEDLTDEQSEFRLWSIRHGIPHATAWTIDEALTVLTAWGCLRINLQSGNMRLGR